MFLLARHAAFGTATVYRMQLVLRLAGCSRNLEEVASGAADAGHGSRSMRSLSTRYRCHGNSKYGQRDGSVRLLTYLGDSEVGAIYCHLPR